MNEFIKDFVMGYYKKACRGCVTWANEPNDSMYKTYFFEREMCVKMLMDLGFTYLELMDIEHDIVIDAKRG